MRRFKFLCILLLVSSCAPDFSRTAGCSDGPAQIFPDYKDVTVPVNIAPLNFHYEVPGERKAITVFSTPERSITVRGLEVRIPERKWKSLLSCGSDIKVTAKVSTSDGVIEDRWTVAVCPDPVDSYLTYRLIEPAYQMWNEVCIMERNVTNFKETVICDYKHTDNACMNCHVHGQQRGDLSLFYVRGPRGGAILNREGNLRKLNLKNSEMISSTVYGDLHPSGRFGVFSTNIIIPGLHSLAGKRMEVYDTASDLTVADFDNNRMINSPHVARADKFETFPCFSADGNSVFYCVADTVRLPQDIKDMRYSLVRAAFDPETGEISEQVDTVWDAGFHNASVCHPKASPDGKWLMYTVADFGTFPINHSESALQMTNLQTGETNALESIKGDKSDTYHSWSSNSRWFVFASKRGDGQYGKPYFCHIDEQGNPSKPFVLPQKSARFYENTLKSFNIPDLGKESTGMNVRTSRKMFKSEVEGFEK